MCLRDYKTTFEVILTSLRMLRKGPLDTKKVGKKRISEGIYATSLSMYLIMFGHTGYVSCIKKQQSTYEQWFSLFS